MSMKIFNGILVGNRFKDLTGQKFNKLTVLKLSHIEKKCCHWLCRCACGRETTVQSRNLGNSRTKSCGCLCVGTLFVPNTVIKIDDKTTGIIIESKKHGKKISLIDKEDYDKIKKFRWHLIKDSNKYKNKFYTATHIDKKIVKLHRLILNSDKYIDHINGNSLNNKKENLRKATNQQNIHNSQKTLKPTSSKYKGVSWAKKRKKWRANILFNLKHLHLGYFLLEEDAARAYNQAAIKYFREFARLNEIKDVST